MKRTILILIFSLATFTLCSCNNIEEIYGTYVFDEVVYLSELNSVTADYKAEQMADTKYIISENSFEMISPRGADYSSKTQSITYKNEKLDKEQLHSLKMMLDSFFNGTDVTVPQYSKAYKYTLYSEFNGKSSKMKPYIYTMDDEIWVVNYVDNTADHSDLIMSIYKLKQID